MQLGLVALLFVLMKASFVRHDPHQLIAVQGLLLLSIVLATQVRGRRAIALVCIGVLG